MAAAAVILPSLQEYRPTLAIVDGITEAMTCTAWSPPQPTIGMMRVASGGSHSAGLRLVVRGGIA
jgi:hypothetical protein